MISLRQILSEISAEKKSTSWLDPYGVFHAVNYNHGSTAADLTGNVNDPMAILWRKGWQRITYYSRESLFCENNLMPPNEVQKQKLIELALELHFPQITYDNEVNKYVIWSEDDTL